MELVSTAPNGPTDFKAELDAYFAQNPTAPTLTDWVVSRLSEEQQEMYALLMQERLTATERFPVHFDPLWKQLGYSRKDVAKRLLETYTLNEDYTSLTRNAERDHGACVVEEYLRRNAEKPQGGAPREDIYLTLNAAQKFALQSRGKFSSKVADFFIKTVEVMQGFHVLSMMYQEKQSKLEARAAALLSIADKKPVTYLGDIGVVDGKRMVKHGSTDNIVSRNNCHKRTFDEFNLIAVYETPNHREVEKRFKTQRCFSDNQVNVVGRDGSVQTECFVWNDDMNVSKMMKVWKSIDEDLSTQQQLQWKHEEFMAEMELKKAEAEVRKVEAESKARIAAAEMRKAEIELRMLELRVGHNATNDETVAEAEPEPAGGPPQDEPVRVYESAVYGRFLDEMCASTPGVKCHMSTLLDAFSQWANASGLVPNVNIRGGSSRTYGYNVYYFAEFVKEMDAVLGPWRYVQKNPKVRGWYGVTIRRPEV